MFNQKSLYIAISDNDNQTHKAMTNQLTIREIRKILFDSNKYAVIGAEEMTNKESRDYLYNMDDQDSVINVIDNGTHLLIW